MNMELALVNVVPLAAYIFATAFTPGPNNLLSMSNGSRYGYRKSLIFLSGIFSGFWIVLFLSALLNLALVSVLPTVGIYLKVLGAVYMIYLAVRIVTAKVSSVNHEAGRASGFLGGFGLQFINFKGILYAITIFSVFVIPFYKSWFALSLFSLLFALIGFIATSCWALFGVFLNKLSPKYKKIVNLVMGALLVYSAVSVFFD
jgi:cysteine/O-acetylserine efflux protein